MKMRLAAPVDVKTGPVLIGELLDDLEVCYQGHNPKERAMRSEDGEESALNMAEPAGR